LPSAVIRGSNAFKDFGVTELPQCHIVSPCVTSISFPNIISIFLYFFAFLKKKAEKGKGTRETNGVREEIKLGGRKDTVSTNSIKAEIIFELVFM
jgi:hypothetical protein